MARKKLLARAAAADSGPGVGTPGVLAERRASERASIAERLSHTHRHLHTPMSADYWCSTQRLQWKYTRELLAAVRKQTAAVELRMAERGEISRAAVPYDTPTRIFLHLLVLKLGQRLGVRQVAVATANVYCTRFHTLTLIKETNPYLLVATCVYLACKIEECSQHIRTVVSEARGLWPDCIPNDATKVAEFEFYLIQELDGYLVLHHPYRLLVQMHRVLGTAKLRVDSGAGVASASATASASGAAEAAAAAAAAAVAATPASEPGIELLANSLQTCWSIINDLYITDLHLLYPPHIVAAAAVFMTTAFCGGGAGTSEDAVGSSGESAVDENGTNGPFPAFADLEDMLQFIALPVLVLETLVPKTTLPTTPTAALQADLRMDRLAKWMGATNINLAEVVDAVQELLALYASWERYDEGAVKRTLAAMLHD